MKIALVSAVWGRAALTSVWWKAATRVVSDFQAAGYEAQVFVSGSESAHLLLCQLYGGVWCEQGNEGVGEKWNVATRSALAWGADYIFILGSDDFFSPGLIQNYCAALRANQHYMALSSMYAHDVTDHRTMIVDAKYKSPRTLKEANGRATVIPIQGAVPGTLIKATAPPMMWQQEVIGAGRCIHKSWFDGLHDFWEPELNRALDASLAKTLGLHDPVVLSSSPTAFMVDMKTAENLWSYDALVEWFPECQLSREESHFLSALPEWGLL